MGLFDAINGNLEAEARAKYAEVVKQITDLTTRINNLEIVVIKLNEQLETKKGKK